MAPSHVDWVPPESFDEYRLVKALGRGSMGQVWLAHDTVLDRLVAVKFIAELPAHDVIRQRFLTEARAAARVQHPNIIAVYRIGEIGPRPYLISEYVRGGSLDQLARPIAWPRLLEIAIGLARGLAAAHRQGVLHRDLKPANAILSEAGEVKLLDFGLAKLLPQVAPPHADAPPSRDTTATLPAIPGARKAATQESLAPFVPPLEQLIRTVELPASVPSSRPAAGIVLPSVTSAGAVMGTPSYMPPEAWRGEPATPRSDVYSLGAMLHELAAGAPPHRGDSPEHVRQSVLAGEAPPLATVAPGIDPRFAAVVDRCLRRDPTERFPSGDAVREALEALAADDRTAASRVASSPRLRRLQRLQWAVVASTVLALALFAYNAYKRFGGEHAPRAMVRFAAATVVPGVFDASRRPQACSSLGEDEDCAVLTSPERVTPVRVEAFELDVREVSNGELAEWLNAIGDLWTADTYGRIAMRHGGIPLVLASEDCFGALAVSTAGRVVTSPDKARWPATCVTWHGANEYCRAQHKRLPLAAEWELAAKGAEGRPFPWGSDLPTQDGVAFDLRDGTEPHPRDVGSSTKDVSPEGIHDLGGNVTEWVEDGRGAIDTKMIRGGSWGSRGPCHLLGSGCKRIAATKYSKDVGFRCARSVTDGK